MGLQQSRKFAEFVRQIICQDLLSRFHCTVPHISIHPVHFPIFADQKLFGRMRTARKRQKTGKPTGHYKLTGMKKKTIKRFAIHWEHKMQFFLGFLIHSNAERVIRSLRARPALEVMLEENSVWPSTLGHGPIHPSIVFVSHASQPHHAVVVLINCHFDHNDRPNGGIASCSAWPPGMAIV